MSISIVANEGMVSDLKLNLRRSVFVAVLLLVCIGQFSFMPSLSPDETAFSKTVIGYLRVQHDSIQIEVKALERALLAEDFISAKGMLTKCRLRYKKMEAFVACFFQGDARLINGTNELEIEDDDEPDFVIYPHGLQVIEGLLYGPQPENEISHLVSETDSLSSQLMQTTQALEGMPLTQRAFFEALQMQLIRLFMFTAVNAETPESHAASAEMIASLKSMKELLRLVYPIAYEGRAAVLKVLSETLDATCDYLSTFDDISKADYFRLYTSYYIPLSDQLRTARGNMVDGDYESRTALNLDATSVFDQAAFNTFFFNPTQKRTGSAERAALGQILFFDPVLSENNKRACAGCHRPEKAFTDGLPKSMSMDAKTSVNRNAPTLINAAIQGRLFHDARTMNLESQAGEVLTNPLEMHHDLSSSVNKLKRSPEYVELFKTAFEGTPDTFISRHSVLLAISEYERTLVSFNSRFDKTIRGEEQALSASERDGFQLYMTKGQCASCHFLPLFAGSLPPEYKVSEWEVLGTPKANDRNHAELDPDPGRAGVHKTTLYKHAFKTPGLRNVELTAPYMHNGVFNTLEEVMDFYNVGGGKGWGLDVPNQSLSSDSLRLTKEETGKIIAFLKSLTDTVGMTSVPASLPAFPRDHELNQRKIGGVY